ncbi:MAG: hypothetical protein ACXWC9_11555 [Pseudobdellovibrionaceae bacterium]
MKQMNWNKIKAVSMVVLSLGFVSIGFQNCSKVGVADLGSSADSKLDAEDCPGCSPDAPGGSNSGGLPGDGSGRDRDDGRPNNQPLNEEEVAVAQCLKKEGLVLSGPDAVDIKGNATISSDLINLVSFIYGNLKVIGKSANASAARIEHIHGNLLLCGVTVDSVEDVKGNLILVNSKVINIHKVGGNLRAFGASEVGSMSEIGGNTN